MLKAQHPLVIAHRGASGYLPEHTRAAKVLAYGMGADFLEQDVVGSRDGQLIVLHDIYLDDVSNVAEQFPKRQRQDGRYYTIDFDADEILSLEVTERRRETGLVYPNRFRDRRHRFRLMTLEEELALISELNRMTGRRVGIYPEIKRPDWHHEHGLDLGRTLLDCLEKNGYGESDPVFVQCFDHGELRRLRQELKTQLPLVQLLGDGPEHDLLVAGPDELRQLAKVVNAIGPSHQRLWEGDGAARPNLTAEAQRAGLQVHPYTFRKDDLPAYVTDLESMLRLFFDYIGVDGLFCDFPDVAVRVRDQLLVKPG